MLMMAEHSWFQEAIAVEADYRLGGPTPERTAAYAKLKEQWKESALEILFLYFPKVRTALYCVGETNSVTAVVQLSFGTADAAVALLYSRSLLTPSRHRCGTGTRQGGGG
jgi:hypothetical protein